MKENKIDCNKTKISISEMVLPNHTNNLNTLFGGKLIIGWIWQLEYVFIKTQKKCLLLHL